MIDRWRFDLHVHSMYSPDSSMTLEAAVARLPHVGLKGFALTDHNSVRGHAALAELQVANPSYLFLPGVEVSTIEGHLLAYGVREAPPVHRPVAETIDWVRSHGGVPVPAHPFRWSHGVGPAVAESVNVDVIEGRNGHNSEVSNLRAEELAARRNLGTTGGSDSHGVTGLGKTYTEFDPDVATVDDLLEALRKRTTSGAGLSLSFAGRLRVGLRTAGLLASRGFRRI